ncbi:MAG TPA: filamentous hemagglutinin N-terminal domain-containing protein, partial [Pseudolabrys sp.]
MMFSRFSTLLLATTALVPLGLAVAVANPLGAQVVGGNASVQGQGTANVTVTQTTDKAIINWNTFNVGANEATRFVQPGSSSIALNRVTGGLGPSELFGTLSANGRIFLVNPDGILVGPGAKIDTAGFLATTHDIANADFMAGRYNFSIPGRPDASVVNQGTITAQNGGFAALVAPGVRNSGTITATLGTISLAAGNGFTLDFYGDKLITLGVNDSVAAQVKDVATGQTLQSLVSNDGKLSASGGRVELTAAAARQVVDSVINNTGVIEANSIGSKNGMIVLGAATASSKPTGAPTQTVKVSGTLAAAGKNNGEKGGKVQITGEAVELAGAHIDASGAAGGGTVLIGGDWSGGHPVLGLVSNVSATLEPIAVPIATTTAVDAASTIDASATAAGNGGKVIVWANGATTFAGSIAARGGAASGNGGFVETSGHRTLGFTGTVDTRAPKGQFGTLLLDPADYYIVTALGGSPTDASEITNTALDDQLVDNNITLATNNSANPSGQHGDIFVNADVSWNTTNSLTLNAFRNIEVNAAITAINGGLVVNAQNAITASGAVIVGAFTLAGGNWNQVTWDTLPGFSANDFRITGG